MNAIFDERNERKKPKNENVLYYEAPGLCIVPEEDGCGDSKSETDGEQADEEGARQGPGNS